MKSLNGGSSIKLSDNSTLFATNVLVAIHDTDMTGVVIDQPFLLLEQLRLMVQPTAPVTSPIPTFEDELRTPANKGACFKRDCHNPMNRSLLQVILRLSYWQMAYRKMRQTHRGASTGIDCSQWQYSWFCCKSFFTASNWEIWQNVPVSAYNDNVTEGVDLLNFPSQPSFLSYIQGPLTLYGLGDLIVPEIEPPLMLPSENDTETVVFPEGVTVARHSMRSKRSK